MKRVWLSRNVAAALTFCTAFALFTFAPLTFAQMANSIPDFHSFNVGWVGIGNELEPPASGPGPVLAHPDYPYISNAQASRTGEDANFRIADLNNPTLQLCPI